MLDTVLVSYVCLSLLYYTRELSFADRAALLEGFRLPVEITAMHLLLC